ncbi:hypothetical protein M406DRAFT_353495 [Cryphonectria parasitica EP155]|uniref:Uncharacterized protein n=1 Tax=Cryphonectria parasitica (strain ATCC 38755 / EP155) TaxID=660469 RepID=A0A9P5CKE7_CRYP1|nr:uncharacterized protein M406DRAFT_353495 [Cryphonectria parasitica EP155]KAF3760685.1 hypothetical protein M406DRAFT_353495 [Cryphonectria parasitica EP155]
MNVEPGVPDGTRGEDSVFWDDAEDLLTKDYVGCIKLPYQVQDRMDWLNDLTEKVEQAERFGIVFERPLSDIMSNNSGSPDKKWLNWRWPCYEYRNSPDRHPKLPSSRIVIQWMVHNGTVLQKTTVRNLGERPFNAKFQFSGHILIRELDCFDNNHSFNNADSNDEAEAYSSRIGPHGYSWVCVHKFPATGAQQNSSTEAGPPSSNQAGEESLESRSSPPFAAATVVTIFKNGEALKFPGSDPKNPYSWRHNIKPGGKMELVIAFRLIKLDQSQESWKNFVIPACDADVDKFLNEEKLQPTDLFISQLRSDNKDSSDNNQEKSSTRYTSPVGRFDRSPDNHIEFMVRRNLEHILSLLKATQFSSIMQNDEDREVAHGPVLGVLTEWLTALEKADRRGKFAWPHATKEDMKIFRLDDHLWIFFALKSVLNLGESFLQAYDDQLRNEDQQSNEDQLFNEDRLSHDDRLSDEKKPKVKISRMRASVSFRVGTGEQKFNANDLQMEVLRRFTAENGNAEHDENDDGTWTTTLRFALAIAMGSLEKRINKKTPRELVKTALDVLFRLTGFNGVVPGESDEAIDEAMQPKIFDDERYRHFYFHAGFEVPFLLLTLDTRGTEEVLDLLRKISRELSQRNRSSAIKNHRLIMKKSIPFNIQIDSTSIVEIGDEWLFNYPAFFGYESDETTDFPSALKIARDDLKEHSQTKFIQRAIDEVDAEQEANGQGSEASRHGQLHARQQMPATRRQKDSTDTEIDAKILDIPKYKHLGKRRDTRSIPWSLRKQAYSGCGRHLFL